MQENELLNRLLSLKYIVKWLSEHKNKDFLRFYDGDIYADKPQAGGFFTFAGEAIGINPKKVDKIIETVNSLSTDELMDRLYQHGNFVAYINGFNTKGSDQVKGIKTAGGITQKAMSAVQTALKDKASAGGKMSKQEVIKIIQDELKKSGAILLSSVINIQ